MSNLANIQDYAVGEVVPLHGDDRVLEPLARLLGRSRAERLLRQIGVGGLRRLSAEEMVSTVGVAIEVAERVAAARDLAELFRTLDDPILSSTERVLGRLPPGFRTAEVERLLAFALDGKLLSKGAIVLAQGGASQLSVTPTDVLRPLVRLGATAFILVHNHPSADPTPSREDVVFTNRITLAARLLGMQLVDHIVVSRDAHLSFFETGLLLGENEIGEEEDRPF